MKIKKVYENTKADKVNKETTEYIIWKYYEGPIDRGLPSQMKKYYRLEEAVEELKEFKTMYKGTNIVFFISKNINSVKVLSDEDIELEINVKKYNL